MENDDLFVSWPEVISRSRGRDIVLYGRSEDWVHKALAKLEDVQAIVDRDSGYRGTIYLGVPVVSTSELSELSRPFFVITAGAFESVVDDLEASGFARGIDFCCSPDFRSYSRIQDLEKVSGEVFFSSSDYVGGHRARGSTRGGGLYRLDLESGDTSLLFSASLRQLRRLNDGGWLAVDHASNLIVRLTPGFEVEMSVKIPSPNACGLALNEQADFLFVADAKKDCVYVFDSPGLTLVDTFYPFGHLGGSNRKHHINDLEVRGSDIFFSYFSSSGEYQSGIFDGGVSRIDYAGRGLPEKILGNLHKPHSPRFLDGELYIADSMNGSVFRGRKKLSTFPGFIRGLDGSYGFLAVGQSVNMYLLERDRGLSTTIINAGVYLMRVGLDGVTEAKFYPTPGIKNIHDISLGKLT